jgi:hypothetical protein
MEGPYEQDPDSTAFAITAAATDSTPSRSGSLGHIGTSGS